MEPKHATAIGATGTAIVATVLKFWVSLFISHWTHVVPSFDDQTAFAHAALIVWAVAAYAMAKGVTLPPLSATQNGNPATPSPSPSSSTKG